MNLIKFKYLYLRKRIDGIYNNLIVSILINNLMRCGEKASAEKLLYTSLMTCNYFINYLVTFLLYKGVINLIFQVRLELRKLYKKTLRILLLLSMLSKIKNAIRYTLNIMRLDVQELFLKQAGFLLSRGFLKACRYKNDVYKQHLLQNKLVFAKIKYKNYRW